MSVAAIAALLAHLNTSKPQVLHEILPRRALRPRHASSRHAHSARTKPQSSHARVACPARASLFWGGATLRELCLDCLAKRMGVVGEPRLELIRLHLVVLALKV